MINLKHSIKLSYTLVVGTILAFMVSALLFFILQSVSAKIVHAYCLNPEVTSRQEQKKVSDLQRYIFDHNLSIFDYPQIDRWAEEKDLTIISIYYNNSLIYDSKTPYYASNLDDDMKVDPLPWQKFYSVSFLDQKAKVIILDHFEHRYRDYATYFNLLLFFISFISIMLVFIKRKVTYITTLGKEIKILEGGNLDYSITVKGNDELSLLAQGIDEMRRAFIIREDYAHQIKTASTELMAGISHDLRTPLTTLIGYLDIATGENNNKDQKQNQYLTKSKERAYQLKTLIDNLFQYFFVSTKSKDQLSFAICSGTVELDKIIQEHLFFLEQHGFCIHNKTTNHRYLIEIHLDLLQRVFDNLFSNILKYADPSTPIKIINYIDNGAMVIELRNKILQNPSLLESTGLGLKTCEKIMEQHKGQFIIEEQDTQFIAKLFFPIL